jgi:hypothetical protein
MNKKRCCCGHVEIYNQTTREWDLQLNNSYVFYMNNPLARDIKRGSLYESSMNEYNYFGGK